MAFWSPTPILKNIPVSLRSSEGQGVNTVFLKGEAAKEVQDYIKQEKIDGPYGELWVNAVDLSNMPR